jgi:ankyrin repeat protein
MSGSGDWNAVERATVEGFNAARQNETLNANESEVMHMIWNGDTHGLYLQLTTGRKGHFLGIGDDLYNQETPMQACVYGPMSELGIGAMKSSLSMLMDYGADINQLVGVFCTTVLSSAMFHKQNEIVEFLLENGANVNLLEGIAQNGGPPDRTLLFSCANPDIAEKLIEYHADVNATESLGYTPLHYMTKTNFNSNLGPVASVLIAHGALLEARTLRNGLTPLHTAARYDSPDVASILIDAGADINAQSGSLGRTPLHIAAKKGSVATMRLLLSRGASMTTLDHGNRTALEVCQRESVMRVLRREQDRRKRCEAVSMGFQSRTGEHSHFQDRIPEEVLKYILQHSGDVRHTQQLL